MPSQHETTAPDRHLETPISTRFGPDRKRLEEYAARTGQPVRRVIVSAVRDMLDRADQQEAPVAPVKADSEGEQR